MKKGLCVLAVLLALVLAAPAAEACSASNAIQKGDYIYDNDIDVYEIIEDVVLTEIQPDEEWTNPLAIHAGVRLCQLVLMRTEGRAAYRGRFWDQEDL